MPYPGVTFRPITDADLPILFQVYASTRPQRLYSLNHPAIGDFTLFLVPVGQEKEGYIYQSVFNVKKQDAD